MNNKITTDAGKIEVKASGRCMRFLINDSQDVIIKKTEPGLISVGDIIVFKENSGFLIHRVIRKYNKDGKYYFKTKGDMSLSLDNPVYEAQIEGRLVYLKNIFGTLDLTTTTGRMYSWSIGGFSFVFYLITKLPALTGLAVCFGISKTITFLRCFIKNPPESRKLNNFSGNILNFVNYNFKD